MWGHPTSTFPWGVHTRLQQGTITLRPQEKRSLIFGLVCTNIWKGIHTTSEGIRGHGLG